LVDFGHRLLPSQGKRFFHDGFVNSG